MKEVELPNIEPIEVIVEQKKQINFFGDKTLKKGHTMWELDADKQEMRPAEYDKTVEAKAGNLGTVNIHRKLLMREN